MEALPFRPSAYWKLDGSSPFTDYSGYGNSAVRTGTETKGVGLVSNALFSQVLNSSVTIAFASPAYRAGREAEPFSLAASVYPIKKTSTGDQQILSNSGKYDGLSINGTVVSFTTKYTTNGEARCSYDLGVYRRVDIVGVHTRTKNSLYVNGRLVDEVDITSAQQASTYDAPNTNLYAGNTSSTQALMLNSVAIFNRALPIEDVSLYAAALNRRFAGSVPRSIDGAELRVSKETRHPYLDVDMTEQQWNLGVMKSVSTEINTLVPDFYNDLTIAGTWERSFNLYNGETPDLLQSLNLQWTGKNVTVLTSINEGTSWVTATSGVNVSSIPAGFDPTDKQLMIRVEFDEGEDEAYIENFELNAYITDTYTPVAGRPVTYTGAVTFDEYGPLELRDNWGVQLFGGTLAWAADNSEEVYAARTIEMWLKKNSATDPTFSFTPTTTYIDGSSSGTAARGEWALYHFVLPSNATTFSISGDVTVGRAAIYNTALSAGAVLQQYTNYVGVSSTAVVGDGTLEITEPATAAVVYAHDWSISAS